jgi:hypothetical protein
VNESGIVKEKGLQAEYDDEGSREAISLLLALCTQKNVEFIKGLSYPSSGAAKLLYL